MSRVTLTVKAEGHEPLVVVLDGKGPEGDPGSAPGLVQARRCADCLSPPGDRLCALLSNCAAVLGYFSQLVSCSEVTVQYTDGRCQVSFPDTAQRAASLLLIYCMIYSRCHFFSRFRFLLKYYPCITSPEALMHLIVTTGLIGKRLDQVGSGMKADSLDSMDRFNAKVRQRLECVFENVRDLPGQDSVKNAFQILHSVNYITGHHAEAFIVQMAGGILAARG